MNKSYFLVEPIVEDDLIIINSFDSTWTLDEVAGLKNIAFGEYGVDRYNSHMCNCYVVNVWDNEPRVELFEIISFNHDNRVPASNRIDNYSLDESYFEWLVAEDIDEYNDKMKILSTILSMVNDVAEDVDLVGNE